MTERLDLEATMRVYADEAVTIAQEDFHIQLDYTEDSLEDVEAILDAIYNALPRDEWGDLDPTTEIQRWLDEMSVFWGAYIGEVILHYWEGEWTLQVPPDFKETTALRVGSLQIYPISKIYRRLLEGFEHDIVAFYEEIIWHLSQIGGPEDPPPLAIAG